MAKANEINTGEEAKKAAEAKAAEEARVTKMNKLARRIWDGQMTTLPLGERIARVKNGLFDQGYQDVISELRLPVKDLKRYL